DRRAGARPAGAGRATAAARDPSGDQHCDRARGCAGPSALELDRGAEQPTRTKGGLGWRLPRRDDERRQKLALPLPQDRPLYRTLTRANLTRLPLFIVVTLGMMPPGWGVGEELAPIMRFGDPADAARVSLRNARLSQVTGTRVNAGSVAARID